MERETKGFCTRCGRILVGCICIGSLLLVAAEPFWAPQGESFEFNPAALSLTVTSSGSPMVETTFHVYDAMQDQDIAAPSPEFEAMLKSVAADRRPVSVRFRDRLMSGLTFQLHTSKSA